MYFRHLTLIYIFYASVQGFTSMLDGLMEATRIHTDHFRIRSLHTPTHYKDVTVELHGERLWVPMTTFDTRNRNSELAYKVRIPVSFELNQTEAKETISHKLINTDGVAEALTFGETLYSIMEVKTKYTDPVVLTAFQHATPENIHFGFTHTGPHYIYIEPNEITKLYRMEIRSPGFIYRTGETTQTPTRLMGLTVTMKIRLFYVIDNIEFWHARGCHVDGCDYVKEINGESPCVPKPRTSVDRYTLLCPTRTLNITNAAIDLKLKFVDPISSEGNIYGIEKIYNPSYPIRIMDVALFRAESEKESPLKMGFNYTAGNLFQPSENKYLWLVFNVFDLFDY